MRRSCLRLDTLRQQNPDDPKKKRLTGGSVKVSENFCKKGLDKEGKTMYNIGCRKPMQPAAGDEYTRRSTQEAEEAPLLRV